MSLENAGDIDQLLSLGYVQESKDELRFSKEIENSESKFLILYDDNKKGWFCPQLKFHLNYKPNFLSLIIGDEQGKQFDLNDVKQKYLDAIKLDSDLKGTGQALLDKGASLSVTEDSFDFSYTEKQGPIHGITFQLTFFRFDFTWGYKVQFSNIDKEKYGHLNSPESIIKHILSL